MAIVTTIIFIVLSVCRLIESYALSNCYIVVTIATALVVVVAGGGGGSRGSLESRRRSWDGCIDSVVYGSSCEATAVAPRLLVLIEGIILCLLVRTESTPADSSSSDWSWDSGSSRRHSRRRRQGGRCSLASTEKSVGVGTRQSRAGSHLD